MTPHCKSWTGFRRLCQCVLCVQICHEFTRFSTYMPAIKVANFFGGIDIKKNREELKNQPPQVVVGTPGRIKQVHKPCPNIFSPPCNCHRNFSALPRHVAIASHGSSC